ncbi:hypothetical protein HGRIS_010987 [Hohenbuehelia grisea]|uniref:DUF6534 domain-containing protein n=1 Tax=Hohenbuehelia grisea TaxID=104357 RepID=A0ABR3IYG7_9AGAR
MDSNGINMTPVFAPIYWGTAVSLILCGVTVLQAYTYFPHPSDRKSIQIIAACMAIFDFASTALVVQSVYHYLVPHFGSVLPLQSLTPQLSADCMLSTIITLISQLYFVAQLHSVTKTGKGSWWIPVTVAFLAIVSFVFGIACTATMFIFHHDVLAERNHIFNIFFGLAKGFGALTDIVATIAMCKLLSSARTGMQQTNSMLKSIMNYIIHRGVAVTLVQTLLLITFYAMPKRLDWLAFHVNVTKLYANTFFAMINSREHLKQKHATTAAASFNSQSYSKYHLPTATSSFAAHSKDVEMQDDHVSKDSDGYPMNAMPTVTKTVVISDL